MMPSPVLFSSSHHDWGTPPHIFLPLHDEFEFTVDAAASRTDALLPRFWSIEEDGLAQDWAGERVWCNPPYGSDQIQWIKKAAERVADVSVLLIPARVDTKIWHECIFPSAEIRFVRGRIRFVGAKNSAPFPSAICVWRSHEGGGA